MKKIMMAAAVFVALSVSAFGVDGTVSQVIAKASGSINLIIVDADAVPTNRTIVGTAEGVKAMLAVALTAKSLKANVTCTQGTVSGESGWNKIILK